MYREGRKVQDILRETGVPRASLYAALDKAGVIARQPRRQRLGAQPPPELNEHMMQWAIDRIAHLEAENARLSEKLRSAKWMLDD